MFNLLISSKKSHFWIYSLVLVYLLLYILLGSNAVITIHDNLDSEVVYRVLLKRTNTLFNIDNSTQIEAVMNGLPRNAFGIASINFVSILFYFFKPIDAYIINFVLIKIIAFSGFYLLLKRYVFNKNTSFKFFIALIALTFILLNAYTIYGLTVLGLPMLLFSVLNIINRENKLLSYSYIIIFPLYSSLVLGGYAIMVFLGIAFLYFLYKKTYSIALKLLQVISIFLTLYIISELGLIQIIFFENNYISHRNDWILASDFTFYKGIRKAVILFLNGKIHSPSNHLFITVLVFFLGITKFKSIKKNKAILLVLLTLISISLFYGLYKVSFLNPIKEKIGIFKSFQFDRFYFLSPFLWYLLLGLVSYQGLKNKKIKSITMLLILLNSVYVVTKNKELKQNLGNLFTKEKKYTTYKQFFSESLFNKVKVIINRPIESYRVIGLGVFPSILQYNGFYTLDSYQTSYPLSYKNDFRQIIKKELEKSNKLKKYFDEWGSRCYLFSHELEGKGFYIIDDLTINIDVNIKAIIKLRGNYILSAVMIRNNVENNLELLEIISDDLSKMKIYLYKINTE